MSQFVWTFPGGKPLDNVVIKGTAAAAGKGNFSEDEDEHRFTVPIGKVWLFFGGIIKPDVNTTAVASLFNSDDVQIGRLSDHAAGVIPVGYPEAIGTTAYRQVPFIMKAGDYIKCAFGAQQAAAAYVTCNVLEIDAP